MHGANLDHLGRLRLLIVGLTVVATLGFVAADAWSVVGSVVLVGAAFVLGRVDLVGDRDSRHRNRKSAGTALHSRRGRFLRV